LTIASAVLLFLVVPECDDGPTPHSTLRLQVGGVIEVMTSPVFWRVAPVTFTTQASFLAVQSLWTGPWLRDIAGFDRAGVANGLLVIAVAMMAGFILAGAVAERLGRLGIKPVAVALVAMTTSMTLQAVIVFELPVAPMLVWAGYALFGTSGMLVYAGLSQTFPKHLAGRVNTGLNLMVFVASFLFQWGVGLVINLWPTTEASGYEPVAYQAGFGAVLAVQVIAMLWLIFSRRAPLPLKG
ncbi:MAG: MFS transporter, partial [Rhodospirillales bacterium]|jgi:predicted MFS family arabinose efflux permease|nr:MFS transporter [Rhodospirillales bacterium]